MRNGRAAVFIAAAGAAIAMWLIGDWVPEATLNRINNVLFVVAPWLATVSAAWAARSSVGRHRLAWLCLTVGLLGWAVGASSVIYFEALLSGHLLSSSQTWPFVLFPIGCGAALLLFPTGLTKRYLGRFLLDGGIVAGSFFLVFWLVVMDRLYRTGGAQQFAQFLPAVFAALEIAVLTLALLLLFRGPSGLRGTLALLTAGLLCVILSDSVYTYISVNGSYQHGTLVDTGWIAGMLLITVAAVSAGQPASPAPKVRAESAWASVWLPGLTTVLVVAAAASEPIQDLTARPVLALGVCLVFAIFARQFLAISDNQRLLAKMADQAVRDPLTGVANYTGFNDRLAEAMERREPDRASVTLMVLDLNDFKLVNDSYGHPVGDRLLKLVAERITGAVRAGDTVARLGGDEFAVIMTGPVDDCDRVARRVVDVFASPFMVDGHELTIRPSAGLAFAHAGDSAVSAEALLKQADTAMYSAKWAGAGGVHIFTAEMASTRVDRELFRTTDVAEHTGTAVLTLLTELRHAVNRAELTLVYQPQFRLQSGDLVAFEALVRWPQPDGTVLMPLDFLPMVRRNGMMDEVTDLVLINACRDAARWQAAGIEAGVAVNLFAPSLADATVPGRAVAALTESGLAPGSLTVEITEHLVLGDLDQTRQVLHRLRDHQIRVAIDDFGTGYSTLSYLRDLPNDEVKLDRYFVAPVLTDPTAAAVVRAVVDLAHTLGMTTVAEGVENARTAAWLRQHGCDVGQGYFYGAPIDLDTLLERFAPPPALSSRTAPASAKSS